MGKYDEFCEDIDSEIRGAMKEAQRKLAAERREQRHPGQELLVDGAKTFAKEGADFATGFAKEDISILPGRFK